MTEIQDLIQSVCKTHGIDDSWIKALITQESNWDQYAVRYEVNYRFLYKPEEFYKKCNVTLTTEINTQKMSWGLGQIMGALAREQGHQGSLPELVHPGTNIMHMCIYVSRLKQISCFAEDIFAMYNGGPDAIHKESGFYRNQIYVNSVLNHLQKFTV